MSRPSLASDKLKVFISSKMLELRDVREIAARALDDRGIDAWVYEADAGARPEDIVKTSLKEVEASDIYVGLFWEKYGEVTIQEYRYARELEKPCFIYIRDKNCQRDKELSDFLKTEVYDLRQGLTYDYFDSAIKLGEQIADDIIAWLVHRHREMTAEILQARISLDEIARLQVGVDRLQAASRERLPEGTAVDYLSHQLRAWFKALNYGFENHDIRIDDYFEWIINVPVRRGYDRILVRGIEGVAEVSDIADLREAVDKCKTDEGWLIVARRKSPAARDAIEKKENHDLFCYTFDELLDENADFNGYLDWLEAEVKRRGIDRIYVPLVCTKEEFDPFTKQKIGQSRYDERNGWIDGYLDQWLDDPAKEHISILGEFGTGKTWFTLHYAWVALQHYRRAKARGIERPRLPLVIPLRDYAKAVSVESLFSEFFFRKHEIPLPNYSAFEQLNRMGKLLLIFDGFDEMADRVDRQKMINNFWVLTRVVVPGAKAILTCRTEHFPEAREGRALLNAELQASLANLTGAPPQFEVLELCHFSNAQIRQVLSFHTEHTTVNRVMRNYKLLELARRPVMIELILEALSDIEVGKPIDLSHVYLYAVRRKMERDIKEERTFTSLADKLYFLCELSWEMLSNDQMSLNYKLFPDRLRRLFGPSVQNQKDLDHWHYDMMGQTMLIRNADGDYSPAHRSLLEFFVAYKFAAELGVLSPDFTELAQNSAYHTATTPPQDYTWSTYFRIERNESNQIVFLPPLRNLICEPIKYLATTFGMQPLTETVLSLMVNMLNPDGLWQVIEATRDQRLKEVGYSGGNAATLLWHMGKSFKEVNLAGTVLAAANLENADLTQANLYATNLHMAKLTDVTLENADLRKSILTKTDLQERNPITSLAANPIDNQLAASSHDRTIRIWDIDKGILLMTLRGHTDSVINVVFSPNGQELASAGWDRTIKIWDAKTGTLRATLQGHFGRVSSLAYNLDCKYLISGGEDGTVRIWNLLEFIEVAKLEQLSEVTSIAIDPKSTLIAIGTQEGVDVWDFTLKKRVFNLSQGLWGWHNIVFSPNGDFLAVSGVEASPRIIEIATWKTKILWKPKTPVSRGSRRPEIYYQLACDPQGEKLISGTYSGEIPVWHIPFNKEVLHIKHPVEGGKVESVTFDNSGHFLATGDYNGRIYIWSVQTGECIKLLQTKMNCKGTKIKGAKGLGVKAPTGDKTLGEWLIERGAVLE